MAAGDAPGAALRDHGVSPAVAVTSTFRQTGPVTDRRDAAGPAVASDSPEALATALRATGYLADDGLATAAFLAIRMNRPLFCEGEPGTGKTALAQALASVLGAELIRLQCHDGIDATQALYDWDFPRQLLHLRALEATASATGEQLDADTVEASLYDRRFLLARPILRALQTTPSVLLVDEVDRADDEFEAFLLEVLTEHAVSIPELGEVRAATPPVVVLTSNRTREVHDALKRRCVYAWIDYPDAAKEQRIVAAKVPGVSALLAGQVTAFVQELRTVDLYKPSGVSETLDWAAALVALDQQELSPEMVDDTLGLLLKHQEDIAAVRGERTKQLLVRALNPGAKQA